MKKDREKLFEELKIREEDIKRIKKIRKKEEKKEEIAVAEKANWFIVIANLFFRNISLKLANKKFFQNYKYTLRKADIPMLFSSYLSLIFFITFLAFIFSLFFSVFISIGAKNLALTLLRNIGLALLFTLFIFLLLYFYPSIIVRNEERKIEAELPFAALYMASISSAGVQPLKVLNLLAASKEYRAVGKQIKKVTNQINFFGMDVVSAIKTTNKMIANKKLVELLNGLATNIVTGGNLMSYFEEQAKKALTDYKVSREKFTESAGIYSDIYTGLLIAAPLIFMLVLVIINAFGGTIMGLTISTISVIGLLLLVLLNIIFLIYLEIVTPPI